MIIANLLLFVGGIFGVRAFAQVSRFPYFIQGPMILILCFIGSYALSNDINNVWIMLIAGVAGFFMKKFGFSVAGLVLGLVLGSLIEENIRKMLIITGGDWSGLFLRPIAGPIFLICALTLALPHLNRLFGKKKTATASAEQK